MDGILVEIVLENRHHSVKSAGTRRRGGAFPSVLWHNRVCISNTLRVLWQRGQYAVYGRPGGALHGRRGIIFVLSAPSGAGKTSLSKRIMAAMPDVVQVVTCTTRAPRPGEQDGREYHFLSRQAFEQRMAAGDFLEWAQFNGQLYGTLRQSVEAATAAGQDVLLVIDVQGAAHHRNAGLDAVYVFVLPPSWEVLAERLRARGSESASTQAAAVAGCSSGVGALYCV